MTFFENLHDTFLILMTEWATVTKVTGFLAIVN